MIFLNYVRHTPPSEPLCWLFPPPGLCFLRIAAKHTLLTQVTPTLKSLPKFATTSLLQIHSPLFLQPFFFFKLTGHLLTYDTICLFVNTHILITCVHFPPTTM